MTADGAAEAWLARISPAEQVAAAAATHAELLHWALTWGAVLLVCVVAGRALSRLRTRARPWPRSWPVWCGAALAIAVFAWAWLPYALGGGADSLPAAPDTPATRAVAGLMVQAGVAAGEVRLSPAAGFDADVMGRPGAAWVSLSREAVNAPPAEVKAYVAHLTGHYVHGDVLTLALVMAACAFAGALGVAAGFRHLARLLGARGLEHPSDPAGLPVLAALAACATMLSTPILAGVGRWANVRADQYALELTRDPDALAAVLVRDWDHRALRPDPLERTLFYSHPPLPERLRRAMAWKQSR